MDYEVHQLRVIVVREQSVRANRNPVPLRASPPVELALAATDTLVHRVRRLPAGIRAYLGDIELDPDFDLAETLGQR